MKIDYRPHSIGDRLGVCHQRYERFGGKSSNLARLYQTLDKSYQSEAVFIPLGCYWDYINGFDIYLNDVDPYFDDFWDEGNGCARCTLKEYIGHFLNDDRFNTDLSFRSDVIWYLEDYFEQNSYNYDLIPLVNRIKDALAAEFGIDFSNVQEKDYLRFRSSSNAEDALEFSGAGLYDSIGIFNGRNERRWPDDAIMKGLNAVWKSLWTQRAVEERMYYQIDQSNVRMGVLVTRGYSDDVGSEELANGIASTFDPTYTGEGYAYQINVQFGDAEVALPEPGVYPEIDRIVITQTGYGTTLFEVERIRKSSLSKTVLPNERRPLPEWVLSEAKLKELGRVIYEIEQNYEFDLQGYKRDQIMLDIEFKIRPDNTILIKQIRPLLKPGVTPLGPIADFEANPTEGEAPLTVNFKDKSTGNITSWQWNFGDSYARWNTSTEKDPTHTCTRPGTYTVSLTVTGPGGSDTMTKKDYITVYPSYQTGYGETGYGCRLRNR